MKYLVKLFLLSMAVLLVSSPIDVQAERRDADAFNHLITSPRSIYWQNNATLSSHRNAFQNAINRSNQLNGIKFYSTNNDNLAQVRAYTMYGGGGNWGYWERRSNYHYVAISDSSTEGFSTNQFRWVALHEIGHALGLVHQRQSIASVMRSGGGPYSYTDYTNLDRRNLNWGYR